ncbi:MAG: DUF2141 domain-containing protein [Hyphomonadaceae bacterium]
MKRLSLLNPILSAASVVPAVLMAAVLAYPQSASADPGKVPLTLTVTDIIDHKGALMVAVFDEAGYDKDAAVAGMTVPVTADTATTTIELPPGRYGIKLFHDVDGDGRMGTNPFGMPTEPYAFSNSAPAQFGPAKWDAAAFDVAAPATTHTIKLTR